MRPYFYEDKSPDGVEEKQEALAIAEFLVDVADSWQSAAESVLPDLVGDWDDYFNYLYRSSPLLRNYWAQFGHLYPDRVKRALIGPSACPKRWSMANEGKYIDSAYRR